MESFLEEWEVVVPSDTTALSRDHPDVMFDVRPLGFRWMVRCSGPVASLDRFTKASDPSLSVLWVDREPDPFVAYTYPPCPSEVAFLRKVASSGGFILPPMTVRDGTTRFRFLLPHGPTSKIVWREGSHARLVSRRRLTPPRLREEVERLAPGRPELTPQQSRVLLEAVRAGYYRVPRRATVRDVARRLSIGRSTAEEHLRAAESSIVTRAAPLIELSSEEELMTQQPTEHFAGFSAELHLYVDLALRGEQVANVRFLRSAPSDARRDHPHLRRILQHIRTGRGDLNDIPVDLQVSPFERRVLEEVRRIPRGETRSYSDIARRIGHPRASRAVGNACAHNPAIVVIPCHRVVPFRGGIGNYSATGGSDTKRQLLVREGAIDTELGRSTSQNAVPVDPSDGAGARSDPVSRRDRKSSTLKNQDEVRS